MKERRNARIGNILLRELIGTRIRVLDHTDPGLSGREGVILDETMGTFLIDEQGSKRTIPKKGGRFRLWDPEDDSAAVDVCGKEILFRPEDRNKKLERKKLPRKKRSPA
jgi:ribonuclease P protein subunit POP4